MMTRLLTPKQREQYEICGRCGYCRINVRHETDREHSIEGPGYYRDTQFCVFLGSGKVSP